MYPAINFPKELFPNLIYPFSSGSVIHKYSQILLFFQSTLFASGIFGYTRAPIVIRDQPFPLNDGPCAYIIPGESRTIESQHFGDGRYFYGFTGNVTIRVVNKSLYDYTNSDELRLTKETTGLLRLAHQVINMFDIEFAEKVTGSGLNGPLFIPRVFIEQIFPTKLYPKIESTSLIYENLTQEPIILTSQETTTTYDHAKEWAAIDLNFRFPYTVEFQSDTFANPVPTSNRPVPSNLADLLLSVKEKIVSQGFLNTFRSMISLESDPFPLAGGPFAVITPGDFEAVSYDKFGAGRDYASMEGHFHISPVVHNITDITGYADNALTGTSSSLSLYSLTQYLSEQLCLSFLYDTTGNFLAENPLDLVRIGRPRYFKKNSSYVTLPLTFRVKYQEDLS